MWIRSNRRYVGIVANNRVKQECKGRDAIGGVIYSDSAKVSAIRSQQPKENSVPFCKMSLALWWAVRGTRWHHQGRC